METIDPAGDRRLVEVVFLAEERNGRSEPQAAEPGTEAAFMPVEDTPALTLRPPLAGYLRGLHRTALRSTAPYLGNLWRDTEADGIGGGRVDYAKPTSRATGDTSRIGVMAAPAKPAHDHQP